MEQLQMKYLKNYPQQAVMREFVYSFVANDLWNINKKYYQEMAILDSMQIRF